MASLVKRGAYWYVAFNDAAGNQVWRKGYTDKTATRQLANSLENEKTYQARRGRPTA